MRIRKKLVAFFVSVTMMFSMLPPFTSKASANTPSEDITATVEVSDEFNNVVHLDKPLSLNGKITQTFNVSQESESLIEATGTDYAYRDYEKRDNTEGRRALYNTLLSLSKDFYDSSDATITEVDSETVYVINQINISDVADNMDFEQAAETYFTFRNDYPIFYFLSSTLMTATDGNGDLIIYILTTEDYDTTAERQACNSIIKKGIDEFTAVVEDDFGPAEAATALYDKMTDDVTYAYEEDGTTPEDAPWAHNILGVLDKKAGVCESYARTYELLLNYLDIDNVFVTGKSHGERHAWNLVGIDGTYYWTDCTWGAGEYVRFYNLKGNNNWADHTPDTWNIASGSILYDLPENISDADCTFRQIRVYENDQSKDFVKTMDDAFAVMTNESSSYKLILNNRGLYFVYTSEWPTVKNLEIKSSVYTCRDGGMLYPEIELATDVTVNSDITLSCVNVVTDTNYYLSNNVNCAQMDIQDNTINILESVYFGGKLIDVYTNGTMTTYDRLGVNLVGGEKSKIVSLEAGGSVLIDSNKVDINTIEGGYIDCKVDVFNVNNLKLDGRAAFQSESKVSIDNLTAQEVAFSCDKCADSSLEINNLSNNDLDSNVKITIMYSTESKYPNITVKSFSCPLVLDLYRGEWTDFDGYTDPIANIIGADYENLSIYYNGTDKTSGFLMKKSGEICRCTHSADAVCVAASDATCTQTGNIEHYKCPDCNTLFTDAAKSEEISLAEVTISMTSHSLKWVEGKKATCSETGYYEAYKCENCNKYFRLATGGIEIEDYEAWKTGDGAIEKNEIHYSVSRVSGKSPTCTEDGYAVAYKCNDCNEYFEDANCTTPIEDYEKWKTEGNGLLAKKGHIADRYSKSPTCAADGYKSYYYCSRCKAYYEDAECTKQITDIKEWRAGEGKLPAGHTGLYKYLNAKPATCTEEGNIDVYFCSDCANFYSDSEGKVLIADGEWVIPAGHTALSKYMDAKPATCTEEGNIDVYYCDDCDNYYSDAEGKISIAYGEWTIPAGHTALSKYLDAKKATCTEEGCIDVYYCSGCDNYYSDSEGNTAIDKGTWIIPMSHNIENDVCTYCGQRFVLDSPVINISRVNGKAKLTWAEITNAAKYEIYRSTSENGAFSKIATVTGLSYTDSNASNGVTYYYKAKAVTEAENYKNSDFGNVIRFTASPNATTVSSVVNNTSGITISWTRRTDVTGYKVFRSVNGEAFKEIKKITSNNTTSYTDTAVSNGAKYQYKIYTYKTAESDINSVTATVKTIYRLKAPSVTLSNEATGIMIKWTKNDSAAGYNIQRRTNGGAWTTVKVITNKATVSYVDK
ncbi:MAG: transglutaminase domain-containing protein, partial [Coprococcus sp.]